MATALNNKNCGDKSNSSSLVHRTDITISAADHVDCEEPAIRHDERCTENHLTAATIHHAPPPPNNTNDSTVTIAIKNKTIGNSNNNNNNNCSHQARRVLAECSSSPYSFRGSGDKYDEQLLQRAVSDAGRWAYGTVLVVRCEM
jgi:hypothetical protein